MSISISLTLFFITTLIYLFFIIYIIQNYEFQKVKYIVFLVIFSYTASVSLICDYLEFIPNSLSYLLLLSRNTLFFFFWITIRNIVKNNFIFSLPYWIILLLKISFGVYVFYGVSIQSIEFMMIHTPPIQRNLLFISNYIFVLLSIIEIISGFKNKPSLSYNKIKSLKLVSIILVFIHLVALLLLLSFLHNNKFIYIIRHISFSISFICISIILNSILKIDKVFFLDRKERKHLNNGDSTLEEKINILIKEQKIYRKQNITARNFEELLNVDVLSLRYVIQKMGYDNFYKFISDCRLNEVYEQLEINKGKKINLERLANDVGFNSYSSFYRSFKKKYKINPNRYIK